MHVQPSIYTGLTSQSKPFAWQKLDNDSIVTSANFHRSGERTENTTNCVKWN